MIATLARWLFSLSAIVAFTASYTLLLARRRFGTRTFSINREE